MSRCESVCLYSTWNLLNFWHLLLGSFQLLFLQIFFLTSFTLSFPSGTHYYSSIGTIDIVSQVYEVSIFLQFIFFSLFFRLENFYFSIFKFTDFLLSSKIFCWAPQVNYTFHLLYFPTPEFSFTLFKNNFHLFFEIIYSLYHCCYIF